MLEVICLIWVFLASLESWPKRSKGQVRGCYRPDETGISLTTSFTSSRRWPSGRVLRTYIPSNAPQKTTANAIDEIASGLTSVSYCPLASLADIGEVTLDNLKVTFPFLL